MTSYEKRPIFLGLSSTLLLSYAAIMSCFSSTYFSCFSPPLGGELPAEGRSWSAGKWTAVLTPLTRRGALNANVSSRSFVIAVCCKTTRKRCYNVQKPLRFSTRQTKQLDVHQFTSQEDIRLFIPHQRVSCPARGHSVRVSLLKPSLRSEGQSHYCS